MKSSDVAVGGGGPPRGRPALVKTGAPAHVGSPGPNRVKVTVPVGAGADAPAPVTVAVSRMGLPIDTGLRAVPLKVATPALTTDVSPGALQGLVADG